VDHLWPKSIIEALEIQRSLKERVRIVPFTNPIRFVAAADAAFDDRHVFAAAVIFGDGGLHYLQDAAVTGEVGLDYIPGLLAFREGRAIERALRKLTIRPDLILLDGHGIAHPEGFGIASHIGVIVGIPTVGCAKSRLTGEYEEPGPVKGDWSYLYHQGAKVGAVVRTRSHVSPIFVSPGHLIDIESSVEIVLRCAVRYRIPEPLRCADRLSKKMKRE
jgi:deoxyribonuclease V